MEIKKESLQATPQCDRRRRKKGSSKTPGFPVDEAFKEPLGGINEKQWDGEKKREEDSVVLKTGSRVKTKAKSRQ